MMRSWWRALRPVLAALLMVAAAAGCARREAARTPEEALVELPPSQFPRFTDDLDYSGLETAIGHSLTYYARIASAQPDRAFSFGREQVPVTRIVETLERFRALVASNPDAATLNRVLRSEYRVFQSTGASNARDVLFTGYYLPELRGSLVKGGPYFHPIYGRPKDLVIARAADFPQLRGEELVGRIVGDRLQPYATREAIGQGALHEQGLELLWVDSPVDAFFLEIQGSGVVRLEDGSTRVLTYAGKNGHRYVAIGGELVKRGAIPREQMSMQAIRAWLEANPDECSALMNTNPSFVFFQFADAARGAINLPVTAGRSIAADPRVFPKGALAFIETERPIGVSDDQWRPFSRFVLDQDSGGAIRTAARVDVFWGHGEYATHAAGHMKHPGRLFYLLAR